MKRDHAATLSRHGVCRPAGWRPPADPHLPQRFKAYLRPKRRRSASTVGRTAFAAGDWAGSRRGGSRASGSLSIRCGMESLRPGTNLSGMRFWKAKGRYHGLERALFRSRCRRSAGRGRLVALPSLKACSPTLCFPLTAPRSEVSSLCRDRRDRRARPRNGVCQEPPCLALEPPRLNACAIRASPLRRPRPATPDRASTRRPGPLRSPRAPSRAPGTHRSRRRSRPA